MGACLGEGPRSNAKALKCTLVPSFYYLLARSRLLSYTSVDPKVTSHKFGRRLHNLYATSIQLLGRENLLIYPASLRPIGPPQLVMKPAQDRDFGPFGKVQA